MKKLLPIIYSPIDENGFSFHIRSHLQQGRKKKISMSRMARLWWIARNSPYISMRIVKGRPLSAEAKIIKRENDLDVSEKVIADDVALLRKTGILIDVVTDDKFLLRAEYKKRIEHFLSSH